MSFGDMLRNALDIPKVTEDGLKYQVIKGEIKIVGFRKNISIQAIPSHIEDLPVSIISGLQSIPFSGELYIPDTVHTIETCALDLTKQITKIVVPESVRSMGHHVFDFSEALTEIIFADNIDLSEAEGLLSECGQLKHVHLPASMTKIPLCFLGGSGIEEIDIPDSVTIIEDCAFSYCESLKRVHLPEDLEVLGAMAFSDCESLETIELPEGLEAIGDSAFSGCENLHRISIPSTVRFIGKDAFWNCPKLIRPEIPAGCDVHEKAF